MTKLLVLSLLLVFALPASAAHLPILASQDLAPLYSPDGRHVAYSVNLNGQGRVSDLYVVDAQTRRTVHVGRGSSSPSATWSSDGRIAWSSGGFLWEANANGAAKKPYVAPMPAYSPAWRPHSEQLAFLTHHGARNLDLWVAGTLWAKDAIGKPSWSPDGTKLAFAREGAIWVTTGPSAEQKVATTGVEPGSPVFSPDGMELAYTAAGRLYTVPADGSAAPTRVAGPFELVSAPAWAPASDAIAYTVPGALELSQNSSTGWRTFVLAHGAGFGASFAPTDPQGRVLAYSMPVPGCPGHLGVGIWQQALLTGTCTIAGTSGNDVIEGTQSWGDVILGGSGDDQIHAGDRHTDRIDCGPGRDTVWADRLDKLAHCEIVHR